jgi:hypothetical protein
MQHLESAEIGNVMVTKVRGRERRAGGIRPEVLATRQPLKLAGQICLLSARAAEALENWGITHPCRHGGHPHFSRSRVQAMVDNGDLRWLSGGNVAAWKQARHLAVRHSGPVTCVQLVPIGR